MKFIIMTPEYNENVGGIIALHKLCHLLNQAGADAYIYPITNREPSRIKRWINKIKKLFFKANCKTNSYFNTPIIKSVTSDDIVVYPEVVAGNPLKANKVIRWFLHHPGYHTGNVNYNSGELYFSFGQFGLDFNLFGSKLSKLPLRITHMLTEYYYENKTVINRRGAAYCLRKGKNKKIVHDMSDLILIDELSHAEIGSIFRKVEYFISYDPYTMYLKYAIMCGCIPIVIPDSGVELEDWLPNKDLRLGVSYGFEHVAQARLERSEALEVIKREEENSLKNTHSFIEESLGYFKI